MRHTNIKVTLISEFYIWVPDSVNFFLVALSFKSNFTILEQVVVVCIHYSGKGWKTSWLYAIYTHIFLSKIETPSNHWYIQIFSNVFNNFNGVSIGFFHKDKNASSEIFLDTPEKTPFFESPFLGPYI